MNAMFQEQPSITPQLARAIVTRAEKISGVVVDANKTDFVSLRVGKRLRSLGIADFETYLDHLDSADGEREIRHLVECLTTHTTSFFREKKQYEWLEQEGFDMLEKSRTSSSFLVWSAAASLGAELWSAGMLLMDRNTSGKAPRNWELLGTDISERILRRAGSATYSEDEISGLSPEQQMKFLLRSRRPLDRNIKSLFRIVPALRARARFEMANLQEIDQHRPFTADIAFLRNVLIYFSDTSKAQVVDGVVNRLRPQGVLLTGHAEALKPHPRLEMIRPTIYRKI
jgi:chemotaxis protein methyltransferase CheR